ncbi:MAG: VOC family protein [Flavobacteriales bacterium]|nr:VOC family protein [Flavobacteriales bacterium]MCB9178172.1 VOC family protein [Flavobacteriales bacterium]
MGAPSFKQHPKLTDYVNWFEIPAYDLIRAAAFYNTIYNINMEVVRNGEFVMAYFPAEHGVGGALIQGPGCYPNDSGVLIYLNAGGDMDSILARIEGAGGRIIMPRTLIGDQAGHFALFIDSEGNRLALHEGSAKRAPAAPKPARKAAAKSSASSPSGKAPAKKVAKKAAPKKRS